MSGTKKNPADTLLDFAPTRRDDSSRRQGRGRPRRCSSPGREIQPFRMRLASITVQFHDAQHRRSGLAVRELHRPRRSARPHQRVYWSSRLGYCSAALDAAPADGDRSRWRSSRSITNDGIGRRVTRLAPPSVQAPARAPACDGAVAGCGCRYRHPPRRRAAACLAWLRQAVSGQFRLHGAKVIVQSPLTCSSVGRCSSAARTSFTFRTAAGRFALERFCMTPAVGETRTMPPYGLAVSGLAGSGPASAVVNLPPSATRFSPRSYDPRRSAALNPVGTSRAG